MYQHPLGMLCGECMPNYAKSTGLYRGNVLIALDREGLQEVRQAYKNKEINYGPWCGECRKPARAWMGSWFKREWREAQLEEDTHDLGNGQRDDD